MKGDRDRLKMLLFSSGQAPRREFRSTEPKAAVAGVNYIKQVFWIL